MVIFGQRGTRARILGTSKRVTRTNREQAKRIEAATKQMAEREARRQKAADVNSKRPGFISKARSFVRRVLGK